MPAHQRSIQELIKTVKALDSKLAQSEGKTEQLQITLGLTLAEAKDKKPKDITWPDFVKEHFDFGRSRADELIQIADGRTTVAETREIKAASVRKSRANPPLRSGGSHAPAFEASRVSLSPAVEARADQAKLSEKERLEISPEASQDDQLFQIGLIECEKEDDDRARAELSKRAAMNAQADRAEQTSAAKLAAARPMAGANAAPSGAKLIDLIENLGRLDIGDIVARMSNDDRLIVMTHIARADVFLNRMAIEIAKAGGANYGKLAPVSLRLGALEFLKAAVARIEAELAGKASGGSLS
jgi:hypothetical protein